MVLGVGPMEAGVFFFPIEGMGHVCCCYHECIFVLRGFTFLSTCMHM